MLIGKEESSSDEVEASAKAPSLDEAEIISRHLSAFSKICIYMLGAFSILNAMVKFYHAVAIDILGILFYLASLFTYSKTKNIHLSGMMVVLTCCYVLFFQSIILEPDAYHNMFFYPPVAVFCFALFSDKKYMFLGFGVTCVSAVLSYLVPKYFGTTIWPLTSTEKDLYLIASMLGSMYATYKIGETLFKQKVEAFSALKNVNAQLATTNDKNKRLLQLIIHDVSNPLVAMDFSLRRVERSGESPETVRKISKVFDPAIGTIKEIIESAREMMALEDGKLITTLEPFKLQKVVNESIDLMASGLDKKDIQIKKDIELPEDAKVLADAKSFKTSVLCNLISNAIKFSHRHSEIKIHAFEENDEIILKVIDTGIGMSEEFRRKVFSPTDKTTRPGTEGEKGTGYGLPLAKAFMDSYGGKIQCVSEEGVGTLIKVTLPKA